MHFVSLVMTKIFKYYTENTSGRNLNNLNFFSVLEKNQGKKECFNCCKENRLAFFFNLKNKFIMQFYWNKKLIISEEIRN